jgi:thiol-disulfide isomerase/thioredoxin
MNKNFLLLVLLTISIIIKSNSQDYNISLKIDGIKYDTAAIAFMSAYNDDDEFEDTAIISNGELNYKFNETGLYYGVIVPFKLIHKFEGGDKFDLPSSRIRFFINNGDKINIEAIVKDKIVTYNTSGNNLSKQVAEHTQFLYKSGLYNDRIEFESQFRKIHSSKWSKDIDSSYWERRKANDRMYAQKTEEFILSNPHYEYSPRLILEIKDKQKITTLYDDLTPESRNSYFGQLLSNMIDGWAATTPGVLLPNFSAKTLSNEDFNLADYRGKYILLDFWGSWCPPCINEIPHLKKLQNDFEDKLVIVGMVCNESKERASKIIEKHNVNWVQLFDENNSFPKKYGIKAYPTKVLIDDKGFVVKTIDTTSDQLFIELEMLLK